MGVDPGGKIGGGLTPASYWDLKTQFGFYFGYRSEESVIRKECEIEEFTHNPYTYLHNYVPRLIECLQG